MDKNKVLFSFIRMGISIIVILLVVYFAVVSVINKMENLEPYLQNFIYGQTKTLSDTASW